MLREGITFWTGRLFGVELVLLLLDSSNGATIMRLGDSSGLELGAAGLKPLLLLLLLLLL